LILAPPNLNTLIVVGSRFVLQSVGFRGILYMGYLGV